jgi:hypothetical protein
MAHLYPLNIYACPKGHERFYSYTFAGAKCWACPDCNAVGSWIGCDGEGHPMPRAPRPVIGRGCPEHGRVPLSKT